MAASPALLFACATGAASGYDFVEGGLDDGGGEAATLPPRDGGPGDATPGDGSQPGGCTGKLVINELMANGSGGGEFIEIYNPSTCAVSLRGWTLKYRPASGADGTFGADHTFASTASVEPKGFYVVGNNAFSPKDAVFSGGGGVGGLGNSGAQVGLLDDKGNVVDALGYAPGTSGAYTEKAPAPSPGTGSVARTSDGVDTDDNSKDFAAGPATAGSSN